MLHNESHLLRLAKAKGACLSPMYNGSVFVFMDATGVYICGQNLRALYKLLEFFGNYDRKDISTEFVALRSDLKRMGKTRKISWVHYLQADQLKLQQGKYVYLIQWLGDQSMRSRPKAIARGPYQGGQMIPSLHGFQKILLWDGCPARLLGMRLTLVPNFLVSWMVDYPL
jgi:hypothetical protein